MVWCGLGIVLVVEMRIGVGIFVPEESPGAIKPLPARIDEANKGSALGRCFFVLRVSVRAWVFRLLYPICFIKSP